jgi:hypothetical protein
MLTERIQKTCRSCGNDDQNKIKVLEIKGIIDHIDIDILCEKCGTGVKIHYDATRFDEVPTN